MRFAMAVTVVVAAGVLPGCQVRPTFVVSSVDDAVDAAIGDGICATASDACSLRAAVQEANAHAGPIDVVLAPGKTYPLSIAGANENASATGDLDVTGNITIVGNGSTIDAGAVDRVIEVQNLGRLRLQGLTVTGGRAQLAGGVRIDPGATAAISASTISGNEAYGFYRCITDALTGGARCSGEDTAIGSGFYDHTGLGGGAGIYNEGTLSLWDSTLSGNTIPDLPETDGCVAFGAFGQACDLHTGAGLWNSGTANLVNVTISANSVGEGFGAAIDTAYGELTMLYVTITGNQQTTPAVWGWFTQYGWPAQGSTIVGPSSGLDPSNGGGVVHAAGSIIDGAGALCSVDLSATSLGYNAAADSTCFTGSSDPTDRPNTVSGLGPLASNGGPTSTHLPLPGSVLIDSIPADASPCGQSITVDQRGFARPHGESCTLEAVEP